MRGVGAALALAVAVWTAAPALADDSMAARLDALEKRVSHLEAVLAQQQTRATELLTLSHWSAQFKQGDLSNSYQISYTLKSHCDKPIKIIDGRIDFLGPNGKRVYSIPLIREAAIAPSGEASFTGHYYLNPSLPQEMRLRDLPPNQIATRLLVTRIVFHDNSVLPLE
jgi:hypothetical protein